MLFCPYCGSLLVLSRGGNQQHFIHFRYTCPTCRFVSPVRSNQEVECTLQGTSKFANLLTESTATDDDFSDALAARGCPTTQIRCSSADCSGQEAFFVQMQIRSADEPPTTFYECTKCKTRWRTD